MAVVALTASASPLQLTGSASTQLADALALQHDAAVPDVVQFRAGEFGYFSLPAGARPIRVDALTGAGLRGLLGTLSRVHADGNNRPLQAGDTLQAGTVYAARFDRDTQIDLRQIQVVQGEPVAVLQNETMLGNRLFGYGGSPDDGTKVAVLYDDSYNTKRYKCWKDGKSGAWDGITDKAPGADNVKNAAVVRRGKTIYVKDDAASGGSQPLAVYAPSVPGQARTTVAWSSHYDSQRGAFAVSIPADAPVGDYQVALGSNRENYATLYVIFDVATATAGMSAEEFKSYAYVDQDWASVDANQDYLNHAFEGPSGTTVYGYRGDTTAESGADGGVFGQRVLEIAASLHGSGASTPLQAAVHAYVVMGERIYWTSGNGYYGNDNGTINSFDKMLKGQIKFPQGAQTKDELDVVAAEKAALGNGWSNRLPSSYIFAGGQCFNYGTNLTAMLRALGIPSRTQYTANGAGWPGSFHVWAEAYLDKPEIHPLEQGWWQGSWYKFDANRQYNVTGTSTIAHLEGNIGPVVIDGYGDYLLNEYKKCNGVSYKGGYSKNAAKCTDAGAGSHAAVLLKRNATGSTANLIQDVSQSASPWAIQDLFVPYNGPSTAPTQSYVISSHHGYALNDSQSGSGGGSGYIADNTQENDLPALPPGVVQRGLVAGHGFAIYRVAVANRASVTIRLREGADKLRVLATLDRMIYSTGKRYELNSDAQSDSSGTLTVNTAGKSQLYLWIENAFTHSNPGVGQEVTWFSLVDETTPAEVRADFSVATNALRATFTDQSTAAVSWSWEFGDGTASTQRNPVHDYAQAGSYTVKLVVANSAGTSANTQKRVDVQASSGTAPVANFSHVVNGLSVTFTDTSTDSDGQIVSRRWDFAGQGSSTEANPTFAFAAAGRYAVSLTVVDNSNLSHTTTRTIELSDATLPSYCAASSSSANALAVARVDLGAFGKASGKSTYSNFTQPTITLSRTAATLLKVTADTSFWSAYARVWIDFDRNGSFDATEIVLQKTGQGSVSTTLTIPATAVVGKPLGMRVRVDSMSYRGACDSNAGWGEVEDYAVQLQ